MPICIECRHPVKTLWTSYSGAGDKSSGHNIRLTVCRKCGRFCDKYVEHDFVVLFIDLVLIKPQVYRHLLHNTLMRDGDRFDVRQPMWPLARRRVLIRQDFTALYCPPRYPFVTFRCLFDVGAHRKTNIA